MAFITSEVMLDLHVIKFFFFCTTFSACGCQKDVQKYEDICGIWAIPVKILLIISFLVSENERERIVSTDLGPDPSLCPLGGKKKFNPQKVVLECITRADNEILVIMSVLGGKKYNLDPNPGSVLKKVRLCIIMQPGPRELNSGSLTIL